ncbi:HBL/NHE enterotoxin family protein [Enterobacter ludwigii]|uniref:HBL/NHE enterotoxin family protein n=1 Tax=unclassified Enterobacter TaxID=2608935 RepID=UPI001ABE8A8C|nr:HBL/NHE enterotoxin family protein [Enterobacter ludwigii]UOY72836.1 HBL/NHE enterotoxin family protein [Enterobacter ludwigii]
MPALKVSFTQALTAQQNVRQQMMQVAQQLEQLPPINDPQISDLNENIFSVRNHANYYLSDIVVKMDSLYSEVIKFGGELDSTVANIRSELNGPDGQEYLTKAQGQIKQLLADSAPLSASLNDFNKVIISFNNDITTDSRNLLADQQRAQQLLAADQARLEALNAQLNALNAELESKKRMEIIIGIFTLGIGAAIMELTGYVQSTERAIAQAQQETGMLYQEIGQLGATSDALNALTKGTAILCGLTQSLQYGWQTVTAELSEVTQQQVTADFLIVSVNAVQANWQEVMRTVEQLQ